MIAVRGKKVSKDTALSKAARDARRERVSVAVAAVQGAKGTLSISQAAKRYDVPKMTLSDRLRGRQDPVSYGKSRQRLSTEEEDCLENWVLQLQAWGWPPRVSLLRDMANKLLDARGVTIKVGINWFPAFLGRHPGLKSKYSRTLDQERYLAEDFQTIQDWFVLYASVKAQYGILDEDTYNMDEKGFMMGVAGSAKVVFSKHEKQAFVKQCGNRDWASLIEAISCRRRLPMWCIFKGKVYMDAWYDALEPGEGHQIALSENGWTDNELGLDWLQNMFEPCTAAPYLKGKYQLLLVDGHSSHVSLQFIEYARSKKIECLCLPAHTTHICQPLDVGVFGPFARSYKTHLESLTRFSTYNIDKTDFLTLVQKARKEGISSRNIESAWRATGLIPYNPSTVLKKLEGKGKHALSSEAPLVTTPERRPAILVPRTPANVDQVSQIDDLISQFHHQTLDTPKMALLSKLIRGAKLAMADRIILNETNTELYEANVQKKKRADRTGKQHNSQGARHLGLEEIKRRREYARSKQKELEDKQAARKMKQGEAETARACKELMRFGPDLLGPPSEKSTPAVPTPKPARKTRETEVTTQKKGRKIVKQRRVQFEEVPVEKRGEKVTTQVSSRGRIIYRRRKS